MADFGLIVSDTIKWIEHAKKRIEKSLKAFYENQEEFVKKQL